MSDRYCVVKAPRSRFLIKENKTSFVIKVLPSYEKASKITDFLNSGGGFCGETPPFFLNRTEQVLDAQL